MASIESGPGSDVPGCCSGFFCVCVLWCLLPQCDSTRCGEILDPVGITIARRFGLTLYAVLERTRWGKKKSIMVGKKATLSVDCFNGGSSRVGAMQGRLSTKTPRWHKKMVLRYTNLHTSIHRSRALNLASVSFHSFRGRGSEWVFSVYCDKPPLARSYLFPRVWLPGVCVSELPQNEWSSRAARATSQPHIVATSSAASYFASFWHTRTTPPTAYDKKRRPRQRQREIRIDSMWKRPNVFIPCAHVAQIN